jgi:zinc transporter ZupT
MLELLTASFVVMLASLAGVVSVWKRAGKFVENNLDFLISFSAGVFTIIAYQLAVEATEHAENVAMGLFWILGGALLVWVLSRLMPALHHHPEEHAPREGTIDIRRMLLSDGVHNIGDGILLAASFAVAPMVGIITTLSVFVHEFIQEISEFFVLRGGGYSARQALKLNFIVSATILFGSVGGYFLLESFEMLEAPLLGLAAGMVMVVILHDLIPHSLHSAHGARHRALHLLWFVIGVFIMFGVASLAGH